MVFMGRRGQGQAGCLPLRLDAVGSILLGGIRLSMHALMPLGNHGRYALVGFPAFWAHPMVMMHAVPSPAGSPDEPAEGAEDQEQKEQRDQQSEASEAEAKEGMREPE